MIPIPIISLVFVLIIPEFPNSNNNNKDIGNIISNGNDNGKSDDNNNCNCNNSNNNNNDSAIIGPLSA